MVISLSGKLFIGKCFMIYRQKIKKVHMIVHKVSHSLEIIKAIADIVLVTNMTKKKEQML